MDRIITLLTDFGLEDAYVSALKGVILRIAPGSVIVDVSHSVPSFNILAAAYILKSAYPHFPAHAVHLAVVDPGVGSDRDAVVIQTARGQFVGPDNGIFTYVANDENVLGVYGLENPAFRAEKISPTFHGRDIFAPAAAHLLNGVQASEMGPIKHGIVQLPGAFAQVRENKIHGSVIHIDTFGSLVTNITENQVSGLRSVAVCTQVAQCSIIGLREAYYQGEKGEIVTYIGSGGHLEIGCNGASASKQLNVGLGADVLLFHHHA